MKSPSRLSLPPTSDLLRSNLLIPGNFDMGKDLSYRLNPSDLVARKIGPSL
jgi:hypothetical protein